MAAECNDPKPGEWRVEKRFNRMSFACTWQVTDLRGNYITNDRGRIKRFRSEEAARIALASMGGR